MRLIFRIVIVMGVISSFCVSKCFSQPKDVMVSNIKGGKVTISWVTDTEQSGYIKYGDSLSQNKIVYDERGESFAGKTHYVTVEDLKEQTKYHYDIISGGKEYDNNGSHYAFNTGKTLLGSPVTDLAYGQVFLEEGKKAAKGTIVYITLGDKDNKGTKGSSQVCSSLIGDDGWWHYNLKNVRDKTTNAHFNYSEAGDKLNLKAIGARGQSALTVDTSADTPVLAMTLKD